MLVQVDLNFFPTAAVSRTRPQKPFLVQVNNRTLAYSWSQPFTSPLLETYFGDGPTEAWDKSRAMLFDWSRATSAFL